MSITNNYNTEPYYDDFDPESDKNYQRILFRPGVSVQARELTQLQSILQNQIARHGEHVFKEGASVTGAEFGFTNKFHAVKINPTNGNQQVSSYLDQLEDITIKGADSGVEARIIHVEQATSADPITLYVNYVGSGIDGSTPSFKDSESLLWQRSEDDIENNITTIGEASNNKAIASTIAENSTVDGTSASIESGIIFVKGNFVHIPKQRVVISKYTSNPSVRIGLEVTESTVSADEDQSLLDTALNAPNYSARGADRYAIDLKLIFKDITDTTSENFVELQRIVGGLQQAKAKTSDYDVLGETLARRTHDESGDYTIKPYELQMKETLNDGVNQGVYNPGTITNSGEVASDDTMTLQVSSGKSYVRGYELETTAPSFLDIRKPRNFETVNTASTLVELGNYVKVNNVAGMPKTGQGNGDYDTVELQRYVADFDHAQETIGLARVRDFTSVSPLDIGNNSELDEASIFNSYLFDIQMFTELTLSTNDTPAPSQVNDGALITGITSRAKGYIARTYEEGGATVISLVSVSGSFIVGEDLSSSNIATGADLTDAGENLDIVANSANKIQKTADGTTFLSIGSIKQYDFDRVKSMATYSALFGGSNASFTADVVLESTINASGTVLVALGDGNLLDPNGASVSAGDEHLCRDAYFDTVTGFNTRFSKELHEGDALLLPTGTDGAIQTRYVKEQLNQTTLKLWHVADDGGWSAADEGNSISVVQGGYNILRASIIEPENNILLREIEKSHVKTLKTAEENFQAKNDITVSKQFEGVTLNQAITLSGAGESFKGKSNANYQVSVISAGNSGTLSNGDNVDVNDLSFSISAGSSSVTITGGGGIGTSTTLRVNAIIGKVEQSEKTKTLQKSVMLRVGNKSSAAIQGSPIQYGGSAPFTSGVDYGTSSHHDDISLGVADVYRVLAVYDSGTPGTDAVLPSFTASMDSGSAAYQVGEIIRGADSGGSGVVVSVSGSSTVTVTYVSVNNVDFVVNDPLTGNVSGASSSINTVVAGSTIIGERYYYDNGQRDNFYDIGKLTLAANEPKPTGDLLIVMDYFTHGPGDFFTVDSYTDIPYSKIGSFNSLRGITGQNGGSFDLRSSIDFRPRVADVTYTTGADGSRTLSAGSFSYTERSFTGSTASKVDIIRDDTTFNFDYEYYLPRQDSIYLTTQGEFVHAVGVDSEDPKFPPKIDNAMRLADIVMPPYVSNVKDVEVTSYSNKRFTMKDISRLEQRINNIEYYTSLSLLEASADNLQIKDDNGLDRFKSGFLVDNFGGHKTGDVRHPDYRCAIDMQKRVLRPKYIMKNITLKETAVSDTERSGKGYVVTSSNVAMLPYEHVVSIEQTYCSTIENLNPVLNFGWTGVMTLEPSSDEWFEINRLPSITANVEGNFSTLESQVGNQLGTVWDAPVTNWTGVIEDVTTTGRRRKERGWFEEDIGKSPRPNVWGGRGMRRIMQNQVGTEVGVASRNGIETNIVEQIDITSNGDQLLSSAIIPFMRQKEIVFTAKGMRPHTRVFPFFDNVDVSDYCVRTSGAIAPKAGATSTVTQVSSPVWNKIKAIKIHFDKNSRVREIIKLSQNLKLSGKYEVLATIKTSARNTKDRDVVEFLFNDAAAPTPNDFGEIFLNFFITRENGGRIGGLQISEIQFFNENYDPDPNWENVDSPRGAGKHYLSAEDWNLYNSLIPNVDYAEIMNYDDFIRPEAMINGGQLVGGQFIVDGINYRSDHSGYSEARCAPANHYDSRVTIKIRGGTRTITNENNLERFIRSDDADDTLMTDASGFVSGVFTIPDPNIKGNPTFATGTRLLRLTSSPTNAESGVDTFSQENYTASGVLNTVQEEFIATRNGRIETRAVQENVEVTRQRDLGEVQVGWYDPVAQSIMPSVPGGEFFTKVDVFFASKDESIPVTLQIREMVNGLPTRKVLPFASVTLDPSQVTTSQNGTAATTFEFPSPVYLKENQECCLVLQTDSISYTVWISQLGQVDVSSPGNVTIDEQPYLGVLFKSQNNSTWTAYDYEDLKFKLYRAKFDTSKVAEVDLNNTQIPFKHLDTDPLTSTVGDSLIKVSHTDHHMYSITAGRENMVEISGVESPVYGYLDESIFPTETTGATFKIIGVVGGSMPALNGRSWFKLEAQWGDQSPEADPEIIFGEVTAIDGDEYTIEIVRRGEGGSPITYHYGVNPSASEDGLDPEYRFPSAKVSLYELNGICLLDLNRTHEVKSFGLDHYIIDIDENSISNPDRTTATNSGGFGGNKVYASENALVDAYQVMVPTISYPDTNIDTRIKTTSGASVSGNQIPFSIGAYTKTPVTERVDYRSPRIIASDVNEREHTNFIGGKSLTVQLRLSSTNENLTPVVDLERKSITAYANRLDNYRSSSSYPFTQSDVDLTALEGEAFKQATTAQGDSSEAIYMTKVASLKNPATSLKVLLDIVKGNQSDVQVMYKVLSADESRDFNDLDWSYFNTTGDTDSPVSPSDDRVTFKEHEYTEDDISEFTAFAIKIKMLGTNSSEPPLIKNLRAIALAI